MQKHPIVIKLFTNIIIADHYKSREFTSLIRFVRYPFISLKMSDIPYLLVSAQIPLAIYGHFSLC